MTMMVSVPIKRRNPMKVFSRAEKIALDSHSDIFFIGYSILLQSFNVPNLHVFITEVFWSSLGIGISI